MLPLRLSDDDASALASLAARLGSPDDKEALSAARATTAMLATLGLDWSGVLAPMPTNDNPPGDHRELAKFCMKRFGCWDRKELAFLYQMRDARWEPSEKQAKWLSDLHARAQLLPESERANG